MISLIFFSASLALLIKGWQKKMASAQEIFKKLFEEKNHEVRKFFIMIIKYIDPDMAKKLMYSLRTFNINENHSFSFIF